MDNATFTATPKGTVIEQDGVQITADHNFTQKIIRQTKVEVIVISDDKLHIILGNHLKKLECLNKWQTPLAILITLVITMLTTNFKKFYLESNVWEAIFWILVVMHTAWLLKSLPYSHFCIKSMHFLGKGKNKEDIEDISHIINKIKSGETSNS